MIWWTSSWILLCWLENKTMTVLKHYLCTQAPFGKLFKVLVRLNLNKNGYIGWNSTNYWSQTYSWSLCVVSGNTSLTTCPWVVILSRAGLFFANFDCRLYSRKMWNSSSRLVTFKDKFPTLVPWYEVSLISSWYFILCSWSFSSMRWRDFTKSIS